MKQENNLEIKDSEGTGTSRSLRGNCRGFSLKNLNVNVRFNTTYESSDAVSFLFFFTF